MKIGISTYTYTWAIGFPGSVLPRPMSALDLLDRAAELNVPVVQIADNPPLHKMQAGELDELSARAAFLGLHIEVGTRGITPSHLQSYLDIASKLRSPILRIVVDTADHKSTEEEVVHKLRTLLPTFEKHGICLAIENHDRFKAQTLARIIERIGSGSVGICLDTVNSLGALEGPELVLEAMGPWVVNLHVKDFVIQRASHAMGFTVEGRPAGEGMLDIPRLLELLRALGRDPNAILELWTPPQETIEDTIAREASWAETSIRHRKQMIPQSPRS